TGRAPTSLPSVTCSAISAHRNLEPSASTTPIECCLGSMRFARRGEICSQPDRLQPIALRASASSQAAAALRTSHTRIGRIRMVNAGVAVAHNLNLTPSVNHHPDRPVSFPTRKYRGTPLRLRVSLPWRRNLLVRSRQRSPEIPSVSHL